MITTKLSQTIYSQLINGKAINKHAYILKTNELEDNGFYNEIFNNFDEYFTLYQRINFELVHKNSCFFYIREFGREDAATLGLNNGDMVKVSAKGETLTAKVKVDTRLAKGVLFAPYHFAALELNRIYTGEAAISVTVTK